MFDVCSFLNECLLTLWLLFGPPANNSEMVEKMEELLAVWSKQIEQVLAESEQIRREADNIGPSAELAYWKTRMAKFNTWVSLHRNTGN